MDDAATLATPSVADPIADVLATAHALDAADSYDPVGAMLAETRALEAANTQAEKALAAEGVALELISLLRVRFEELVEHLLGPVEVDDRPNGPRVAFELRLQQRFARELAAVAGQVARAKLTAPGAVPPGLIVSGR